MKTRQTIAVDVTRNGAIRRAVANCKRFGQTYYVRRTVIAHNWCVSEVRPPHGDFEVAAMRNLTGDRVELRNSENWPIPMPSGITEEERTCATC